RIIWDKFLGALRPRSGRTDGMRPFVPLRGEGAQWQPSARAARFRSDGKTAAPELGDSGQIFGRDLDLRSGGVLAHLRGVARAGDHDADRGMSDAEGDGGLGQGFD